MARVIKVTGADISCARVNVDYRDLGEPVDPRVLALAELGGPLQRFAAPTRWQRVWSFLTGITPSPRPLPAEQEPDRRGRAGAP